LQNKIYNQNVDRPYMNMRFYMKDVFTEKKL